MAKGKKVVTVLIADLKTNHFVRQTISDDRVLYLWEQLEAGIDLGPIEITPNNDVIDGRHRIEVYQLAKRKTIEAIVTEVTDESELISLAYQANLGGALPPSRADTEHTVKLLLERGASKASIAELLAMPPSLARKYINSVQSQLNRAKLMRAADAVTEGGLNIPKAAETHGVDVDKLREILSSTKRKHKQGIPEIKRGLSTTYQSLGIKNASLIRKLFDKFDDSDVTVKQVEGIFEHLENLQRKSSRSILDWKKRFQGKISHQATKEKMSA